MASFAAGPSPGGVSVPVESASAFDARFSRHFAEKKIAWDIFGCSLGAVVYLGLLPSLAPLRRPDLCAAALACSAICLWPLMLARRARHVYVRHRDTLLVAHFLFHYAVGGQLARYIRLVSKLPPGPPAAFLAAYVLSSTVLWQSLDALMYRMRLKRFLITRPIVLLAVLPLEQQLCQQTCRDMASEARAFGVAADVLRLLLSAFRVVPTPAATTASHGASDGMATSCFKVQAFLLVMLSWVLPAFILYPLEKQMWSELKQQSGAWVLPTSEAAQAAAAPEAGPAASEAAPAAAMQSSSRQGGASAAAAAAAAAVIPAVCHAGRDGAAQAVGSSSGSGSGCNTDNSTACTSGGTYELNLQPGEQGQGWQHHRQHALLPLPPQQQVAAAPSVPAWAAAAVEGGFCLQGWAPWVGPLMLAAFSWHMLDTLLG